MNRALQGKKARTGLAALAVAGTVLVATTPASAAVPVATLASGMVGQAGFGTIKGRLVYGGDQVPPAKPLIKVGEALKDPGVCAADAPIPDNSLAIDPKTKGVKFAIVYLLKPNGANPAAAKALVDAHPTVVVDQKNCDFIPHVAAAYKDQTFEFKSSDPTLHNVHVTGFEDANSLNLTVQPNGSLKKKFIVERRPMPLSCDIHPWMKGYIMLFGHPFFAVTAEDGSFEIKGVPAGPQNLVIWQESVGYANPGAGKGMPVTVKADAGSDVGDVKLDPSKVKSKG